MQIIDGDLLEITDGYILHQVNCVAATGGLAGALKRKWPEAFIKYHMACNAYMKTPEILLGHYAIGPIWNDQSLVHIFGQLYPGQNTDYSAADMALNMFNTDRIKGVPVYAPYGMGCGLGGGNWDVFSKIIEKNIPCCVIVRKFTQPLRTRLAAQPDL